MPEFPEARRIALPDIQLSVHEAGEGPAVVFCHGFPDLARCWAHPLRAVAAAGYRAIAPDQRGYGGSDAPAAIRDYDIRHLTGDLAHLLDALEVDRAVFVGHDWGGFVAWAMPVIHPSRCLGVVGVNTPYVAPPATDLLRAVFPDPDKLYMLWFQQEELPEATLDPRARKVFELLMRRPGGPPESQGIQSMQDANPFRRLDEIQPGDPLLVRGEPLLSPEELLLYTKAYAANGFHGPVSWYRNLDRNRELEPEVGTRKLELPCLMVTAAWDVALPPSSADAMPALVRDLERVDIDACGHWTPREKPEELSAALVDWLDRRIRPLA